MKARIAANWPEGAIPPCGPAGEFPELERPSARPDSPEQKRELEEKLRSLGYVE